MLKKVFFLLIIGSLFFSLTACEKEKGSEIISEKEGLDYYQKGEYSKALPLLQKSADSGNPAAYYYLGKLYLANQRVEETGKNPCYCFLRAAEGAYPNAYLMVASCYFVGEGIEQDFNKAFKWGKKAAEVADEIHMNDQDRLFLAVLMGSLYANGKGTLQDFSEAAKWFRQAAEKDYAPAQGMMAFYYYSGKGVLTDKEKAKYWAEKAAQKEDSVGQNMLGMLYQYADNPDMKQAVIWYEKAAAQGNYAAQQALGSIYEKGNGVKKDLTKAYHYYRLAAKSGKDYTIKALSDFETKHKLESNP